MSSVQWLYIIVPWLLLAGSIAVVWTNSRRMGWQLGLYVIATCSLLAVGATLLVPNTVAMNNANFPSIALVTGAVLLGLAGVAIILGMIEFLLLPAVGQFPLGAISRVTYYEALLQPFTMIVLCSGII